MKVLFLTTILLSLNSCGTFITPEGKMVRMTRDRDVVKGCKFIVTVQGSSLHGGLFFQNVGRNSATNEIKNDAAEAGANMILINQLDSGFGGASANGEAYKCEGDQ